MFLRKNWLPIWVFFLLAVSLPSDLAAGKAFENKVRIIYFLPIDRMPQRDINTKLDRLIKAVQRFYADEMQRHGYGRKTFEFETDPHGNAVVHPVKGRQTDPYYQTNTFEKVTEEIPEPFDLAKSIYLIVIETRSELININNCGRARTNWSWGHIGGHAVIPASGGCFDEAFGVVNAAHELGHAFLLYHDFRDETYIMSYGEHRRALSACAAEWLDAYRYFNRGEPVFGESGTIEMLPPQAVPPDAVRLRFSVFDPDGLHQAQLLTQATELDPAPGEFKLIECHALSGESSFANFLTTDPPPEKITLQVLDVHGNFQFSAFEINISADSPPSKVVSIVIEDEPTRPARDVNRDGQVNVLDLVLIAQHFGGTAPANLSVDVNASATAVY